MRVVILQPGYLPWLGFFDQMFRSDVFVVYDDVQYDKHGWRNRNRIKTAQGVQWLTVPVLTKGQNFPLVNEVLIDEKQKWQKKHLETVRQSYSKAPHFAEFFPTVQSILQAEWKRLIDLDMAFIQAINEHLGLKRDIRFSSQLGIQGAQTGRLINICKRLGATHYLTGDAAEDYVDPDLFAQSQIVLEFHRYQHPTYRQQHGDFTPYLSVIDLIFNHGKDSLAILTNQRKVTAQAKSRKDCPQ